MNQSELEAHLQDLPLGAIRYFERIGSTNDEAADWLKGGAPDLALVVADEQTTGRGRGGRKWFSPPGASLAFSLVLCAEAQIGLLLKYQNTARLNGLGALAVCEALQTQHQLPAQIKWPNDVLIDGKKVAGVLAEAHWIGSELTAVALGIGVNVRNAAIPPADWDTRNPLPVSGNSIEAALGRAPDRWQLLHAILESLLAWRARLAAPAFLSAWEANLAFRGQWVQVFSPGSATPHETGKVLSLGADGSLCLQTPSGQKISLRTGEIHPTASSTAGFRLRPVDSPPK